MYLSVCVSVVCYLSIPHGDSWLLFHALHHSVSLHDLLFIHVSFCYHVSPFENFFIKYFLFTLNLRCLSPPCILGFKPVPDPYTFRTPESQSDTCSVSTRHQQHFNLRFWRGHGNQYVTCHTSAVKQFQFGKLKKVLEKVKLKAFQSKSQSRGNVHHLKHMRAPFDPSDTSRPSAVSILPVGAQNKFSKSDINYFPCKSKKWAFILSFTFYCVSFQGQGPFSSVSLYTVFIVRSHHSSLWLSLGLRGLSGLW